MKLTDTAVDGTLTIQISPEEAQNLRSDLSSAYTDTAASSLLLSLLDAAQKRRPVDRRRRRRTSPTA